MAVESIFYSVAGLSCRGALIWDENVRTARPLLLMAPNWRGVIKPAIETGQMLANEGYVVFVADMFGEGNGPVGTEDPMEFLRPIMSDTPAMRRRINTALDTLTREADRRAIGDVTRRAAIGFCFGGLNVLDLARSGADLQAVVSMHGTLSTPQPARKDEVKAKVLAIHGAADPIAPKAERDAFEAEMEAAGVRWALLTWGGVVHAFTDIGVNVPGVAVYDEAVSRHGYAFAHAFIADAFAGKL
ncbi:MAG: dienelactone hydrolase family protein [Xanthobacteraceae bacterium]